MYKEVKEILTDCDLPYKEFDTLTIKYPQGTINLSNGFLIKTPQDYEFYIEINPGHILVIGTADGNLLHRLLTTVKP